MTKKSILIARSDYEIDVIYPFYWAEIVKQEAQKKGFNILDLQKENFIPDKFEKLINNETPEFIFLNGHGYGGYCIKGHEGCDIIEACKNDILLRERMVYALCCDTVKYLSESALTKGCHCYISYDGKFTFRYSKKSFEKEDILNDEIARAFMEMSNAIPLTIINGGTLEEAYENSQKVAERWIEYWGDRFYGVVNTTVPIAIIGDIIGFLRVNKKIQRIKYKTNKNLLYSA